jgi:acetyl-CoA synthetase
LESIFVEHESIAEAAVIGIKHEIKGQGLLAFATVIQGKPADEQLQKDLIELVDKRIGKFARPEKIIFSSDLPKTRSGKIMRRLLRSIADGGDLGNITTLADPSVVEEIQKQFNQ